MKWFLLISLPLYLNAQCLKPGTYYNLKPDEPITLDTGTYTFVGLRMADLGPGTWLNASKARKLELLHCNFEGKDVGTAVLSSGDLTVSHCTYKNLREGILQALPPGSKRKVAIANNVFRDNLVSVRLEVEKEGMSRIVNPMISVRHYKCRTAVCFPFGV